MLNIQRWISVWGTVVLANVFWFVSFSVACGSFWIKISLSAATLAFLAKVLDSGKAQPAIWDRKTICLGLGAAALLYAFFWLAKIFLVLLLPFTEQEINNIYRMGEQTPVWLMVVLALLVAGPGEEYFWRGFLQRQLMDRYGQRRGWLLGTLLYGGVHVWSFNPVLIGAAFVAGGFWGVMYWRSRSLQPVVIAHSVWSALAFALLPFG